MGKIRNAYSILGRKAEEGKMSLGRRDNNIKNALSTRNSMCMKRWTEFSWLRVASSDFCEHCNEPSS
jgi:hypothetical protein